MEFAGVLAEMGWNEERERRERGLNLSFFLFDFLEFFISSYLIVK